MYHGTPKKRRGTLWIVHKVERSSPTVYPDSKDHGAKMGPISGRQDPGGPYVGPMNFAIWVVSLSSNLMTTTGAMCIVLRLTGGPFQYKDLSAVFFFIMEIPIPGKWSLCRDGPRGWFNIKMQSYQYRKFHCGYKTILRPCYLHNGISYTGKMTSLYWIRVLGAVSIRKTVLPGMAIPLLKIRRPNGRLIFNMEIAIPR